MKSLGLVGLLYFFNGTYQKSTISVSALISMDDSRKSISAKLEKFTAVSKSTISGEVKELNIFTSA
jgi:hypothetical protein